MYYIIFLDMIMLLLHQFFVEKKPKNHQVIMLASWNEWGEGNYMEPDTEFGLGRLEALKNGIEEFENTKQ